MNENKAKILVIDDEKDIVDILNYNLTKYGFDVLTASNGIEGLEKLTRNPDLILLDVMMPKMDGFEFCLKVKSMKAYKNIPIIFLTAKTSEIEETQGLNIGANDYIQKPISPKKLIARVKSNLRKKDIEPIDKKSISKVKIGPLLIDKDQFTVHIDGKEKIFPRKEFEVLFYLANNPGRVFSREALLKDVWGTGVYVVDRTVDVHIRKIREKLDQHSDLIETIKGVGYRFKSVE